MLVIHSTDTDICPSLCSAHIRAHQFHRRLFQRAGSVVLWFEAQESERRDPADAAALSPRAHVPESLHAVRDVAPACDESHRYRLGWRAIRTALRAKSSARLI